MTKEKQIRDWIRMFKSQTDPDEIAKHKRIAEREKRMAEKKSDTGL